VRIGQAQQAGGEEDRRKVSHHCFSNTRLSLSSWRGLGSHL
jgi:hypothetical protein